MVESLNYAQWAIRLSVAAVFLWFGIDKFIHPEYWIAAWFPTWLESVLAKFRLTTEHFAYLNGIFEVLVGVSFVSGIFVRVFAAAATLFLIAIMITHGMNEIIIRDIAIAGSCIALFFWPDRHRV